MAPGNKSLAEWFGRGELLATTRGKMFVRVTGEGEPLLLLHGFPTASWDWHRLVGDLEERFAVFAVDMLGYGFSEKPDDVDYSTPLQAQLLQQVIQAKGINAAHIMAFSYGVSVAQELLWQAQRGDSRFAIKSLCFLNGGLFPESNHPRLSQKLLLSRWGWLFRHRLSKRSLEKNLSAIFGEQTQPGAELIDQYWALLNRNNGRRILPKLIQYLGERKTLAYNWERSLIEAPQPIQLIFGEDDDLSGLAVVEEFRSKVGSPYIDTLEGIGHYPQLESPQKVIDRYFAFIDAAC